MCRLVAYLGPEIILEEVLVKPVNSIITQSLHARESSIPTNGDGFGLGWYAQDISPEPALFRSIFPAWSDSNLLNLTAKIKSSCFFGHIRAASVGGTNNYNCHPFVYQRWMLMHNGQIQDFMAVKRHLRHLLDDDIYNWIQGETDSEHLFALFLQKAKNKDINRLEVAAQVLRDTLAEIESLVNQYGTPRPSYFNICLTNGQLIIASRYCTDKDIIPESMRYLAGNKFSSAENFRKQNISEKHECVMIASERLTDFSEEWEDVPPRYLLLVDKERRITLCSIQQI